MLGPPAPHRERQDQQDRIERKVLFTRHGREDEGVPLPPVPAGPVVRQLSAREEHAAAQGLLGRVVARLRGGH